MNLSMNMSRFYLKNNKVISHPADIKEKEQVNEFAINIAKQANLKNNNINNNQNINQNNNINNNINNNNQKQEFKGKYINR